MRDAWLLCGFLVAALAGMPAINAALRLLVRPTDANAITSFRNKGLRLGGAVIGALERGLAYVFVLAGDFGAIGLILAAKGLIRYGEIRDAKDQKVAEYVLVGTMLSLLWAVLAALAVQRWAPGAPA